MTANNQAVLIGRVGNNPAEDTRSTQTGSKVASVNLAVTRPGKDAMGNTVTDWITCQFWNKNAERLAEYVQKGDLIAVSGSIRVDSWEKDGQKRLKYFVHGENFQMLESRRAKEERRQALEHPQQPVGGSVYRNPMLNSSAQPQPDDDFNDEFALDDDELPPF